MPGPYRAYPVRRLGLCIAIVAVLGAMGGAPASAQDAERGWRPCAAAGLPDRECTDLVAPLDWDEPDGATIAVAVARGRATEPDWSESGLAIPTPPTDGPR